jgi:hypothetical protein
VISIGAVPPSGQMMIYQPLLLVSVSETSLLAGRADEATRHAEQAVRVARERGDRGTQAHAFRLLGEIASDPTPPDVGTAEARYREGLALADELGMRPLVAQSSTGALANAVRPDNTSPPRPRCTATWT